MSKHVVEIKENSVKIVFDKEISEKLNVPDIDFSTCDLVQLDMREFSFINSLGIQKWVQWSNPIKENIRVEMTGVHYSFLQFESLMMGFLPEGLEIHSIVLPYFCDSCENESDHSYDIYLLDKSNKNEKDLMAKLSEAPCSHCAEVAELDTRPKDVANILLRFWPA